ncbi:hypothetical protein EV561_13512 [Rhizobium sp. BK376]|nr:hypothetical protein EV561_13512 [Rhizobium sp. BK376]
MADGVRPPLRHEVGVGLADFRPKRRAVTPAFGLVDVDVRMTLKSPTSKAGTFKSSNSAA